MYLRTVQLGIQDLAGHPWLLHACAICAAIRFCVWVSMHPVVAPLFCRLRLQEKLSSINKCLWKIPAVFAKQVPGVFLQPS